MRRKIIAAVTMVIAVFTMSACSSDGNEKAGDEETTLAEVTEESTGEGETQEESGLTDDNTYMDEDFSVSIGSDWKYAYTDGKYAFYYMNVTEAVYDSNVILSITTDDNLGGAGGQKLADALKEQYAGESIEVSVEDVDGYDMVCMKKQETDGDIKAYVGQYIVIGKNKGVVFSVYGEESKFQSASESTKAVVGTIHFNE